MSSLSKLSVLAFASTVLASPYAGHAHGHSHNHKHRAAPYPYSNGNSTSAAWGTTGGASSSSTAAPTYSQGGEESWTSTVVQTVFSTLSFASAPSSAASAGGYGSGVSAAASSGEACAQDVTVTSTEKVYITITPGQSPSSSESSPVESTSAEKPTSTIHLTHTVYASSSAPSAASYGSSSAPSAPAYSAPSSSSSSSPSAPVSSSPSSPSAPAYSAPSSAPSSSAPASSSSEAGPKSYQSTVAMPSYTSSSIESSSAPAAPSTYSAADKQVEATSTSSAAASTSSTSSSSGGKRGLAYNSAELTTCFDESKEISWAYNWVSASAGLTGNLKFIPTLHDASDTFTSVWNSEASASIASGSTTLFSFNEPDESSQSNMSPEAAAEAYKTYMNPFAGKAQLCAPSVTNGGGEMGLTWLQNFVDACAGDCHIDCYNIHWYSPADAEGFKQHVNDAAKIAGDKPIWVSEFGCTGASDDQVSSFLEEVMPWMDSNDSVAGYAYYMVSDGALLSGTEPSTYGETYMTYTS